MAEHTVSVIRGITNMWVARCTCGYVSPRRTLKHKAEAFGEKHRSQHSAASGDHRYGALNPFESPDDPVRWCFLHSRYEHISTGEEA